MKMLFENLQTYLPPPEKQAGEYGIPVIEPTRDIPDCSWVGFNYVGQPKKNTGIHFFLDDRQFQRVWNQPDKYVQALRRFACVCAPDFSVYTDMPKALQIYSHYKKHWCAAYWKKLGLQVVPTISWSNKDSFSWCFDGEPMGSVVAIGTTGTQQSQKTRQAFLDGYREMIARLHPTKILVYGQIPAEISGDNVVGIGNYSNLHFKKEGE